MNLHNFSKNQTPPSHPAKTALDESAGESHGLRSLAGYSPWGHKESDTTEGLTLEAGRVGEMGLGVPSLWNLVLEMWWCGSSFHWQTILHLVKLDANLFLKLFHLKLREPFYSLYLWSWNWILRSELLFCRWASPAASLSLLSPSCQDLSLGLHLFSPVMQKQPQTSIPGWLYPLVWLC